MDSKRSVVPQLLGKTETRPARRQKKSHSGKSSDMALEGTGYVLTLLEGWGSLE